MKSEIIQILQSHYQPYEDVQVILQDLFVALFYSWICFISCKHCDGLVYNIIQIFFIDFAAASKPLKRAFKPVSFFIHLVICLY